MPGGVAAPVGGNHVTLRAPVTRCKDERSGRVASVGGGAATLLFFATDELAPMHTSFDQTRPQPSRWDQDGAEYVRSSIDWCARCSKRLVALNPGLTVEQALDLAYELSSDDALRALMPERVAEDLHRVDLQIDE